MRRYGIPCAAAGCSSRPAVLARVCAVQIRHQIAEVMEDHRTQLVMLGFLVLDLMAVFGEVRQNARVCGCRVAEYIWAVWAANCGALP